jgi:amidase
MSEIVEKTAVELRALIGARKLSPVEVFDAFSARIEQVNPAINAMVAMDTERARAAAKKAEQAVMKGGALGILHGLPVGVKDLNLTEGLTTTFGSLVFKDNVPAQDELMVARIRAAGGIIIGKTNTPEFGSGANTINRVYGATVNPFDTHLSTAGSSGGSAAALATDMVPLATGSDLGGSLRTPASFCGIVGCRPSPGAVPSDQGNNPWTPLSVEGPMGRNVPDAALLMAAMVGDTSVDPIAQPLSPDSFIALPNVDLKKLRVAFTPDFGCVPIDAGIRDSFAAAADRMKSLFGQVSFGHPDVGDVDRTFEALRAVGYGFSFGDYIRNHRNLAGPNVIANVEFAQTLAVEEVGRAHAAQAALFRDFDTFFKDVDILVCPAASVAPYSIENVYVREVAGVTMGSYIRWVAIAYAITLSTHPSTVIPAGLGPTGMPFGLQIVGRHRDDLGTMAVAAAIEAALAKDPKLARPKPDIAKLSKPGLPTAARSIPAGWTAHVR